MRACKVVLFLEFEKNYSKEMLENAFYEQFLNALKVVRITELKSDFEMKKEKGGN